MAVVKLNTYFQSNFVFTIHYIFLIISVCDDYLYFKINDNYNINYKYLYFCGNFRKIKKSIIIIGLNLVKMKNLNSLLKVNF